MALQGFGSHVYAPYLEMAKKRAAEFVAEGGYTVSSDQTTIVGVRMIIFKEPKR